MKLKDIHWQESDAEEYLTKLGGSKSGAYQYLFDVSSDFHRHLPTGTRYLAPGDDVEKFLDKLDYTRSKIVRACHPLDLLGMVDVIPTLRVFQPNRDTVRHAILTLLQDSEDSAIRSFVDYESGATFDGKIGILVQDFCGFERGSIVEHPHQRGLYRIGREYETFSSTTNLHEEMFVENGGMLDLLRMSMQFRGEYKFILEKSTIDSSEVQRVIELYRRVQDSGLMPASHSFQMEYGIDDRTEEVMFFQSRLFRSFQPRAAYDPEYDPFTSKQTLPYLTFGITPESGIEMPLAELNADQVERYRAQDQVAYAYDAFRHRHTTQLDVQPRNLGAYFPSQSYILEHGHFRWAQKAPVTLLTLYNRLRTEWVKRHGQEGQTEEMKVKITSNGIRGVAELLAP